MTTIPEAALPALSITGTVTAVSSRFLGTAIAADTASGVTTIQVLDNATIAAGDQLHLHDPESALEETVTVRDVDGTTTVNLIGVTTNAYPVTSNVERVPAAAEVVAFVAFNDDTEPLPVVVEHALADALARGVREPGRGETVQVTRGANGELRVANILDRSTTRPVLTADDAVITGSQFATTHQAGDKWAELAGDRLMFYVAGVVNFVLTADGQINSAGAIVSDASVHASDLYTDGQTGAGTDAASLTAQGRLIRTPSTRKAKKSIRPMKLAQAEAVLDLEPVTFRLRAETNGPIYPGFIAEQAAEVGADLWVTHDTDGEPTGFRYPEVTAALVLLARRQRDRVSHLENALASVTARLDALEGDTHG